MEQKQIIGISKKLSLILRHKPQTIGLQLDKNGWAEVSELIEKFGHPPLSIEALKIVVAQNDKQRFAFNEDFSKIRANQGHSIGVDLELQPVSPPDILYHGTATQNLLSIRKKGLIKGSRQHVHLSKDTETAKKVGTRHGFPAVLQVKAGEMHAAGFTFYCSDNGVWLTDNVPSQYLIF